MTVRRPCEGCGVEVIGRSDRRFCSDRCRQRVRDRERQSGVGGTAMPLSTRVADALRAELEQLGAGGSYAADVAIGLAQQLDSGTVLGAAYVSLSRELDRRVDALRLSADRPDNPVTQLQTSVAAKQAALRLVES